MGFEPFIIPKREQKPEGKREDRVAGLAKLLYQRGLTSSMTDALRLAEGMVEVENKVIRQRPKEEEAAPAKGTGSNPPQKRTFGLPADFLHFVTQAGALSHETTSQPLAAHAEEPMRFGRDMEHTIAQVPHIMGHKQVMFDDAPELKTRESASEIITGDGGIKATKVETTPASQTVEEVMIVEAPEPGIPAPRPDSQPTAAELLEEAAENTAELQSEAPREQRDLAKEHGVDLFNMFKVKK